MTAADIIATLELSAHPEGGWYRQTWEGPHQNGRAIGTCIYFLLKARETSHWHRVDAEEIWLFHAGDPLALSIASDTSGPAQTHALGPDIAAGQRPQIHVPSNAWQSAQSAANVAQAKGWTLVSCTVTPGFRFDGFELAPKGLTIPSALTT